MEASSDPHAVVSSTSESVVVNSGPATRKPSVMNSSEVHSSTNLSQNSPYNYLTSALIVVLLGLTVMNSIWIMSIHSRLSQSLAATSSMNAPQIQTVETVFDGSNVSANMMKPDSLSSQAPFQTLRQRIRSLEATLDLVERQLADAEKRIKEEELENVST